eukprot:gene4274-7610_t
MQEPAIEMRTKLILDRETEEEIQNLSDFKLEKTIKRKKLTQSSFENEQKRIQFIKERDIWIETDQLKLKLKDKFDNLQLEIDHLNKLKDMGVDLTIFNFKRRKGK